MGIAACIEWESGVALFSVTGRAPRNHLGLKRIRPENILKFSDSDLRTVRAVDRVGSQVDLSERRGEWIPGALSFSRTSSGTESSSGSPRCSTRRLTRPARSQPRLIDEDLLLIFVDGRHPDRARDHDVGRRAWISDL